MNLNPIIITRISDRFIGHKTIAEAFLKWAENNGDGGLRQVVEINEQAGTIQAVWHLNVSSFREQARFITSPGEAPGTLAIALDWVL